jgi:hypothetical protein
VVHVTNHQSSDTREGVATLLAGKTIFEVGTRNGDILACVARFASRAYSAEINAKYCPVLKGRGLTVLCDDFRKYDPAAPGPIQGGGARRVLLVADAGG